ncbi:MAG: phosphotransferase [Xanthomonadales bacterium]|nr:phosphotransferase [Xanthomonadales bacterium]
MQRPLPPVSPGSRHGPRAEEATVRQLLHDQVPHLADRPLVRGPTGWDNSHWLLDGDLAVRLPRRRSAVGLVVNEVTWLPVIAAHLPLEVPVAVHAGVPGGDWPWPWSVVPWLDGERSDLARPPADVGAHAAALGGFLAALHVPAPDEAPHNPYRSIPLAERAARTTAALEVLAGRAAGTDLVGADDVEVLRVAWQQGLEAPAHDGPRTWIHGDLHPGNQLVAGGRLVAVVDWGDVAGGDPAADLATAWWTLPVAAHATFRTAYGGIDDAAWRRGMAWAAAIAAYLLKEGPGAGDASLVALGRRTVARLRTVL